LYGIHAGIRKTTIPLLNVPVEVKQFACKMVKLNTDLATSPNDNIDAIELLNKQQA
jgi:hypothetical protein